MTGYVAEPGTVWLGLDLGTQSVRAMAVSASGVVLGSGSHPLTSQRAGPRHEQNPVDWWNAISAACRAAVADVPPELSIGSWNSVLGTTLVLKGVIEHLIRDPAGVVYSHRSPDGGWLPGGASSTGAGVLSKYFPGRDLNALSEQAAAREPTSIVAYPLISRGERFPFTAPDAEDSSLESLAMRSSCMQPCCRAWLSLSGSASTTSTCSAPPFMASSA